MNVTYTQATSQTHRKAFCLAYNQGMMTSSNGIIFRVTGPLCGEFTGPGEFPTQRPVTRSFDVFFDLRLNKWLSKQPWGWWIETPSWSLWRQCNGKVKSQLCLWLLFTMLYSGIIMPMRPTNERLCYIVMSSLIGWAHTQIDPCEWCIFFQSISHYN